MRNDSVNKLIVAKYGINWKQKFEKDVDEEYQRQTAVAHILNEINFIQKKNKKLSKRHSELEYSMLPIGNSDNYDVSVLDET